MATLDFELCSREEFAKMDFTDTTGRKPSDTDGYGQYDSIKEYTGTLLFCDCSGNQAALKTVTPAATGISEEVSFSPILTDGWYEVKYTVLDGSGTIVGTRTHLYLVDGAYKCRAIEIGKNAAAVRDQDTRENLLKNLYLSEMLKKSSMDLANANLFSAACEVFGLAQNLLNNC